jgi:hypothetical protein
MRASGALLKSLAKTGIKTGLILSAKGKNMAAEMQDEIEDIKSEAARELSPPKKATSKKK